MLYFGAVKKKPNDNVVKWFEEYDEMSMYLSVITFGELRKGIEKLPDSKKKQKLNHWVQKELTHRFKNRILSVGMKEVKWWGKILARGERDGTPLPAIDGLIAATAKVHDLAIVTRNTDDMENSGVELINPWGE